MSMASLSNHELLVQAQALVKRERELVADLIVTLREVARRRLYLVLGHGSMFDFCTRRLGLSEDQAAKRLQVTRAAERFPETIDMLRRGEVKLAHLAMAAPKLTKANAALVFAAMRGKTKRQFEAELRRIQPDGTLLDKAELPKTKLVIEATDELLEALERVKGLLLIKGRIKSAKLDDVIGGMAEYVLDHLDPVRKAKRAKERDGKRPAPGQVVGEDDKTAAASDEAVPSSRYIPAAERHAAVLQGDGRCTFVADDGTRCESTVGLHLDHYPRMFCEGAPHRATGLVDRCGAHNRLLAERRLGKDFIAAKIQGDETSAH